MKKQTKEHILRDLKKAQDTFNSAVQDVGTKIRQEVIIPVCKQHKLEFVSGMGSFFFCTTDFSLKGGKQTGKHIGAAWEVEGTRLERVLKPVFEILNEQVDHVQVLGYYVDDVRKADYE
jgi:hypothetical protein